MSLEQLFQRVEAQVVDVSRRLWRDDPRAELRAEIEQVEADLGQAYADVVHHRGIVEDTRARVAEGETRTAMLLSRVETFLHVGDQPTAWNLALELDRIRHRLVEDRARLPRCESTHRVHRARVDHLENRLAELRENLYSLQRGKRRRPRG